jgi:hypothetical protein
MRVAEVIIRSYAKPFLSRLRIAADDNEFFHKYLHLPAGSTTSTVSSGQYSHQTAINKSPYRN